MKSVYASQANLWGGPDGCPGFVQLNAVGPKRDVDDTPRLEGIAAHELLENGLRGQEYRHLIGLRNEGAEYTQEMVDHVDETIEYIQGLIQREGIVYQWVEQRAPINIVDGGRVGVRIDWLGQSAGVLHIMDFKYGRGIVPVANNPQLILNSEGARLFLQLRDVPNLIVKHYIIQPRAPYGPKIRSIAYTWDELNHLLGGLLQQAANALHKDPWFNPGRSCKYCAGASGCIKLGEEVARIVANNPHYQELTPAELSTRLSEARKDVEILTARRDALEDQARANIEKGITVPRFFKEPGNTVKKWKSKDAPAMLELMYGRTLAKEKEYISPAAAIKAGVPEEKVLEQVEFTTQKSRLVEYTVEELTKLAKGIFS